jgi:hypothetical protein
VRREFLRRAALSDEKSGRAAYDRWVVQDITRLILRLALRVATGGDAKSFLTILSNLQQVLILHG